MLDGLFPRGVVVVTATPSLAREPLHPQEARIVAGVSPRRRREFGLGRACAREALARLGVAPGPLLRNSDRTPRWPAGVVGSISHAGEHCAAAVARCEQLAGLGLDLERSGRVTADLLPRIGSEAERAALAKLGGAAGCGEPHWATLLFSAKESAYKCYYPLARTRLGFLDVEVCFEPERVGFRARLLRDDAPSALGAREFRGRYGWNARCVWTGVALESEEVDRDAA